MILIRGYNPLKGLISGYLDCIESEIDHLSANYDSIILIDDFNSAIPLFNFEALGCRVYWRTPFILE